MSKKNKRYNIYGTDLFYNLPFGKGEFKTLIHNIILSHSPSEALLLIELVKSVGFKASTVASFSINLEDVSEMPIHENVINTTNILNHSIERGSLRGQVSESEKFQQSIDLWNNVTSFLRGEILNAFHGSDRLNSIYIMAFSGARGNLNQVRQLVALRGLIADPTGRVLDIPIRSNLNEGLSLTEYLISCYGSRKGVIDTAIRTAHAGYLTRRLVEVGQSVLIRNRDCQTRKSITLKPLLDLNGNIIVPLHTRALGRVLAHSVKEVAISRNEVIGWYQKRLVEQAKLSSLEIRSPLTCENFSGICQLCYGWDLSSYEVISIGEAVGILAAQAIGEPGTQLTMRTFHTGGAFSGEASDFVIAPVTGKVHYKLRPKGYFVHTRWGNLALFTQTNAIITINNEYRIDVPKSAVLFFREGVSVLQGQVLGERISQNITQDNLSVLEERPIESVSGGQVLHKNHPQTCHENYRGITIIQGQNITFSHSVDWSSIGDRFLAHTYYTPFLIQSKECGIILKKQATYNKFQFKYLLTALLVPTLTKKFPLRLLQYKISRDLWIINKDHLNSNFYIKFAHICCYNVDFECARQLNYIHYSSDKVKRSIISILYVPQLKFNLSQKIININRKECHLNFFIMGLAGIIKFTPEYKRISFKLSFFESLFYPFQFNSSISKIQHKICWVFKTKRPFRRARGWLNISNKKFYMQPLSLTLNLNSLKCVKWCLTKPMTYQLYSKEVYLNDFIYIKASSIVPRLHGFEIPTIQSNYFIDLKNSRYYFDVFLKQKMFSQNIDNQLNLLPFGFDIQFQFKSFKNSDLTYNFKTAKKYYKQKWYVMFSFENWQEKSFCNAPDFEHLISYGETITRCTPLYWYKKLVKIGAEINHHLGSISILNYDNFISYENTMKDQTHTITLGKLFYEGDLTPLGYIASNGLTFELTEKNITMRKVEMLTTPITEPLFVKNHDNIEKGQLLTTFKVKQVSISDITQGLPRVEKILEGRRIIRRLLTKKWIRMLNKYTLTQRIDNLETFEHSYSKVLNSFPQAFSRKKVEFINKLYLAEFILKEVQEIVLREVQLVYKGQGVNIADKHIEIILRNLTTRVQIVNSNNTNFLPGELIYPQQLIILLNLLESNQYFSLENIDIMPAFIGLSACGRGSSSFIASSSFQNTRKVLTATVINHSSDWLRGLKSHIIVGSRIPAGTGTAFSTETSAYSKSSKIQWYTRSLDLKQLEFSIVNYK